MATPPVTADQDVVVVEVFIAAPPDRVFQAITDPQQLAQWWGQKDLYRIRHRESDLRIHGHWLSSGVGAEGSEFQVAGEYLEIDPPRLLLHTWVASYMGPMVTTVRWELTPSQGGTLVKVTHSGFAGNAEAASSHGQGWQRVLGWAQGFVEKGETVETRS
jgi:uncharacterized protein YndB with AHSA1/START domain